MPRGKKQVTTQPVQAELPVISQQSNGTIKIDTYLTQIREKCRARGLQIWNKQSLSDLIYQDLLFIYHIPYLIQTGVLKLDIDYISDGQFTDVGFKSLASISDDEERHTVFTRERIKPTRNNGL